MASYADVVKFEEEKPSCNIIRLVKSGEFYRAYNHSAWLFQCCIAEHKVMRKYVKALKCDVFYVGFPADTATGGGGDQGCSKNMKKETFLMQRAASAFAARCDCRCSPLQSPTQRAASKRGICKLKTN